ncbi:unnamed protein product [Urochloa decumbens]|uniref:non-specific serine/threonine protein kinase n=1 Tax=Urochloa decumbens TaxID=240449 RepID=A0ABC9AQN7_9POAL
MAMLHGCLLLIMAMAAAPPATARISNNDNTDLTALLAFKYQLSDPLHLLANNWTNQTSFCRWTGVSCNQRQRVTMLKLPGVPLQGELTPHLGNLSFLHVLNLTSTGLVGSIPDDLGRLPCLIALDLRNNSLSGTIPSTIGNLTRLQTLNLGLNQLQGSIPNELLNLYNLRKLSLKANYLSGQIPNLSSTSTPSLILLSFSNNSLSGCIPQSIGSLSMLRYLILTNNQLTGLAPPTIFNMSMLEIMSLGENNLYGPIPGNESFKLPVLRTIDLSFNKFTGQVPLGLAECNKHLQILSLHSNLFLDVVPTWLAQLSQLTVVSLDDNSLVGTIPSELGNLTMLQSLYMGFCNLSGHIPLELEKMRELAYLQLSYNQLTGPFPAFIGNLSNLAILGLESNQLTGPVPSTLRNLMSLRYLSIDYNDLEGNLDFLGSLGNCWQLQMLFISGNHFTNGSLNPNHVGNLSRNLIVFKAEESQIIGNLPATLSNLSSLRVITLANNQLTNAIPESLAKLENLGRLDLSMNNISGPILKNIGMLRRLDKLNLYNNKISGSIPDGIANLTMLRYLDLSCNELSSNCASLFHLNSIVKLNVSNNFLGGALPSDLGYMPSISEMDLSNNRFFGRLPNSFANLQMLTYLMLSHNSLEDSILDSFRGLLNLETLDLSWNNLSGTIPNYLANFNYLCNLNLSFNNLEGQVPNGGVFSNLTLKSLMGNVRLCGGPPHLGFSPCVDKPDSTIWFWLHLFMIVCRVVFIALCTLVVCLYLSRLKKQVVKASIGMANMIRHRSISYYEIVQATNNFSEDYLLGAGSYGKVFKGLLDDGTVVAIKVLNMQVVQAMQSFDAECKVLRMARHHNLIRILGTCSNMDFRALLLQYMPNGSLEEHMHTESRPYMGFLTRLGIMLDISMAMEYLHHDHYEVILHCDLKPSNVLLDDEMIARVADFGIAKLLSRDNSSVISVSMPGTIGYMAPEYAFMGKASRKSDVFSFGIMLLEVFTGKRPTDPMFVEGFSLRQWVSQAFPARLIDVVDHKLLQDEEIHHICFDDQTGSSLGSSSSTSTSNSVLASVFELGLMCSSESVEQRMAMNHVVSKLEDIEKDYHSASVQAIQRLPVGSR